MADLTKLRVRVGQLEVDFEGSDEYVRTELPKLIDSLIKSHRELIAIAPVPVHQAKSDTPRPGGPIPPTAGAISVTGASVSTIAAKTSAKTGPELALCAAASSTLGKGRADFERKELLEEMQSAPAYYDKNYSANLSKTLDSLVKTEKLRHLGESKFALSAAERSRFESELAQL